jgi:hypothetical protein
MGLKKVLTWALGLYVVATCAYMFIPQGRASGQATVEPAPLDTAVVVYYFYDSIRCQSCISMESYTGQVVKGDYAKEMAAGRILWKPVDIEAAGNDHYLKEFKILSKSVVVAELKAGKRVRWKNLPRVWELVKDEAAFKRYVRDEVAAYVGGGS